MVVWVESDTDQSHDIALTKHINGNSLSRLKELQESDFVRKVIVVVLAIGDVLSYRALIQNLAESSYCN